MGKNEKNLKEILSETENNLDDLLKKEGKIAGEVFHTQLEYIKKKKGEEGLEAFAKRSREIGHELDLRTIDHREWFPVGLRPYAWLVMLRTFDWGREELIDSGYQAPKLSFIIRMFARYFVSTEAILNKASFYWKKHYTIGCMELVEVDPGRGKAVLRIKDFKVSPLFCIFYLGYFKKTVEFGGAKNLEVKETKCMFEGDDYHEFSFSWDA